ncbi:MAG: hypothetical protein GY713_20305 [Actinomycetia bacterium]|nr:hypothetical protein [Actinomycetes bacterium]
MFAGPSGNWMVDDLLPTLERAGVGPGTPNDGVGPDTSGLHAQLDQVVATARTELDSRRLAHDATIEQLLAEPTERLRSWVGRRHEQGSLVDESRRRERDRYTRDIRTDTEELIESMRTTGQPPVRVLAVLVGAT